MSLKRKFAVLCAVLFLLSVFTLNAFAFENPGYDVEEELFPGTPIIPLFASYKYAPQGDSTEWNFTMGSGVLEYKQQGVASLAFDMRYYQEQLLETKYYTEIVLTFDSISGTGSSPRFYISNVIGKTRGKENYAVGWSFSYNFTSGALTVLELDSNTPIANTGGVQDSQYVQRTQYIDTLGNTHTYATVRLRILNELEAEKCKLYLYNSTNGVYEYVLSRTNLGNDANFWNLRYACFDKVPLDMAIMYNHRIGDDFGFMEAYDYGLEKGRDLGFTSGYGEGKEEGYGLGYDMGYDIGYDDGLLDGEVSELSVPEVITAYVNSGVTLFKNIFGFEIFGINVSALVGGLTAVVVLAWVIRKLVR